MAKIGEELRARLEAKPQSGANLIVRVHEDVTAAASKAEALGLVVRRRFSLIKGLAITGKAAICLELLDQPWVESIEEDKQVTTMT